MTPQQVSKELVRIATAIDNSKNPDKEKVVSALKKVATQVRFANLDWKGAKSMMPKLKKLMSDFEKAVESEDPEAGNLAGAISGHLKDIESSVLAKKVQGPLRVPEPF